LYWASEELGDPRFKAIAVAHADTAMKSFIREDGSVRHIVGFDPASGEYLRDYGGQGYGEGSSWTRGQSWGIYGFALSYGYTGKKKYLDTSRKIADYVISELGDSYLVPIDYRQPKDVDLEDSTAAAITASGLIELASQLEGEEADKYLDAAIKLLKTLDEKRISWGLDTDNLLNNCAVDYHGDGHNMSIIYGDYYFIEAMMKLDGTALKIF
jgi:unsaturated chondroitin disaccharide hydrolase